MTHSLEHKNQIQYYTFCITFWIIIVWTGKLTPESSTLGPICSATARFWDFIVMDFCYKHKHWVIPEVSIGAELQRGSRLRRMVRYIITSCHGDLKIVTIKEFCPEDIRSQSNQTTMFLLINIIVPTFIVILIHIIECLVRMVHVSSLMSASCNWNGFMEHMVAWMLS